ncbi:amino acid ABC transporter, permease protein [Clostridiaceae bacterium JG1575]|nr:amino acid ABC transporter, permease protein [Clostridiaceae bacterium JG1575]
MIASAVFFGLGQFAKDYIAYFPRILKGAPVALSLTVLGIFFGGLLGLLICQMKLSRRGALKAIGSFYTWFFRGTPMMVQLYFLYFGLPKMGITLSAYAAASIGLSLNIGAYMAEIIRGGIQAIDKGQFEAAKALGMNHVQTMRRIVIPQTVRIILPSLGNEVITLLKDTSLVAAISLTEVLKITHQITSREFTPLPAFAVAATFYLFFTTVLTALFGRLERRLSVY